MDDTTTLEDVDDATEHAENMSKTLTERVRKFVTLTKRKREIETETATLDAQLSKLSELLIDGFADEGVTNMTVDGMNVYINATPRCSLGDPEQALKDLLGDADTQYLVKPTVNTQSLSAFYREKIKEVEGDTLEEQVEAAYAQKLIPDSVRTYVDRRVTGRKR